MTVGLHLSDCSLSTFVSDLVTAYSMCHFPEVLPASSGSSTTAALKLCRFTRKQVKWLREVKLSVLLAAQRIFLCIKKIFFFPPNICVCGKDVSREERCERFTHFLSNLWKVQMERENLCRKYENEMSLEAESWLIAMPFPCKVNLVKDTSLLRIWGK